jgi:hypothetical protein
MRSFLTFRELGTCTDVVSTLEKLRKQASRTCEFPGTFEWQYIVMRITRET